MKSKIKCFSEELTISYNDFKDTGIKKFQVKAETREEAYNKAVEECRRLFPTCLIMFEDN